MGPGDEEKGFLVLPGAEGRKRGRRRLESLRGDVQMPALGYVLQAIGIDE